MVVSHKGYNADTIEQELLKAYFELKAKSMTTSKANAIARIMGAALKVTQHKLKAKELEAHGVELDKGVKQFLFPERDER